MLTSYNRAGALNKITFDGTDYVKQIAYNAKGQRLLIAYGNDVMTRYVYSNQTSRLLRLKSEKYLESDWVFDPQSGTVKQDLAHINDLVGNILTINDKTPNCGIGGINSLTRSFEYDPLYRLTKASGRENNPSPSFPWWDDLYRSTDDSITTSYTQHYSYDKLGNIQSLQHIGDNLFTRNFNYLSSNNKLNSIAVGLNNCNYTYDGYGNQIQENSNRFFEWDYGNRMRCFYNQAGVSEPTIYAQYLYDGTGNRVKKIVRTQGGDYESVCYVGGTFEYKTNGVDEQTISHIMDGNSRIAMDRTGNDFGDLTPAIKYNLEDHLGSSTVLLQTNGTLINREEYYPYGETSFGSYAKKQYRYSGKEKDAESGLYYYGARYYMAWAGRFITCDPMSGEMPQWSAYVGFNDNPIYFIDPTGLKSEGTGKRSDLDPEGGGDIEEVVVKPKNNRAYYDNGRGFLIEMPRGSQGGGYKYLGNVQPEGYNSYHVLVYQDEKNQRNLVHKNVNNQFLGWLNSTFGTDYDTRKTFDSAQESFNSAAVETATDYFLGLGLSKVFKYSKIAIGALRKAKGSLWGVKSISRGFIFEEMLGANLRKIAGYPVIDDFVKGVATSVKTMMLTTKGYTKNPERIYRTLKKYVDDLYKFEGANKGGVNTIGKITSKKIELGIPLNATPAQVKMLEKAVKYAEEKDILLNIRVIK